MDHIELIVFGLLWRSPGSRSSPDCSACPYPVTLVAGGAVIGFLPGVPDVELDPDLVLLIFLPPLLYGAAFFTSVRDLRRNAKPIAMLSIPLVRVTMAAVAVVAHEAVGLDWGPAFVLGAIVSPTDAVAPAEIMRRIGAPRRLITIVEGENLTNDWTALVLYRFAVAAVVTGSFSLVEAVPSSSPRAWAAWRSASSPAASSARSAPGSTTRPPRSRSRSCPATRPTCRPRSSGSPA